MRKTMPAVGAVAVLSFVIALGGTPAAAADKPAVAKAEYVGTEVCSGCHEELHKEWLQTPHRRTLAEGRQNNKSGCESCHGPGSEHVASGGDKTKIVTFKNTKPEEVSKVCLSCHKQADVMLYRTSTHSSSKVTCTNCHGVHQPGRATMLQLVEQQQYSISGLATEIQDAKQHVNIANSEKEKSEAQAKLDDLQAKKKSLEKSLDVAQTKLRRSFGSELCYSCHKKVQAQFKQPSHHPVDEQKMACGSCHNPHGGPAGNNLREENVNQTCFKCHAEMEGPYVFEHPPVSEDCSLCHKPHGSSQNYLLKQSEPFLCLKCHAGPHSRSSTFANGSNAASTSRVPYYYAQCTSCHNRPHGSDRHAAFHY